VSWQGIRYIYYESDFLIRLLRRLRSGKMAGLRG